VRALVVLLAGGCSFAFVEGRPADHERRAYFECTTSRLGPILDTVFGGYMGLTAALLASQSEEEQAQFERDNPNVDRETQIGVFTAFAVLGTAGAIWGYVRTQQCIDAKALMVARLKPNTWPPVPPPAPVITVPPPAPSPPPTPAPAPEPPPAPGGP
jgi:hypothetical protein